MALIDIDEEVFERFKQHLEKKKKEEPLEYSSMKILASKILKKYLQKEEKKE